jgi:predicted transcriptional regulator
MGNATRAHPLAGKIFQLHSEGYSQRQIAGMVELSQSTVQRVLSGPVPDGTDLDGVFAEFNELARAALKENTLGAYRNVHETARVCHANGYDVRWHSLPYLVKLSAALIDARSAGDRNSLNAEILGVYQDMKDWRSRQ